MNVPKEEWWRAVKEGVIRLDFHENVHENALNTVAGSSNYYPLNSLLGPGHQVTTVGATKYVTQYQCLQAAWAEFTNYTQEIPVWLSGSNSTIKFADPISYILSNYAMVITCNPVSPLRWNIDGHWYCDTPIIKPCKAMKRLDPSQGSSGMKTWSRVSGVTFSPMPRSSSSRWPSASTTLEKHRRSWNHTMHMSLGTRVLTTCGDLAPDSQAKPWGTSN